ncbi:Rieske (2Fe-2S) protein [Nonomuraea rhodomycinica]|uniref:Cytochrome bc1 complex Rieske iron-sulfur subunit n=1 Tax=Nonomuraea rhodomycinica TaxID=1712872 RepID=A0A7Y6MAV7_9ACTN|nr:Rieske (2Fe-2S) protein [Nonomuraea rhodomycinica]NUW41613.1 Rieske (2Fe-2S) protein [Nonomuraea rhodomycinica]
MADDLQSRRAVIAGVGVGGLSLALTACGGGESGTTTATQSTGQSTSGSGAPSAESTGSSAGGALAKTGDIPVGGGTILKEQKIVVVQPAAGQFKAFSAICTHKGCLVAKVADGTIDCPCHGSKFKIQDGSVANGPADQPLPEKQIKVEGDQITLA